MSLKTISRYWHTLKYLKPVQLYGRVWKKFQRSRPCLDTAPSIRVHNNHWKVPARREPSLVGPTNFKFLNQHGSLQEHGWCGGKREKLWRYNQHYFDDLNAKDPKSRLLWHKNLLLDWVCNNAPGIGDGWEAYPTSLRIVNWIKWALVGNQLPTLCIESLAIQARWLSNHLETHLLGNHLFANAKALIFAGCFFEGDEANNWLMTGLIILKKEIPEQILLDGGQFELSTMYHALALEDMLDLCNLANVYVEALNEQDQDIGELIRGYVPKMINWLELMSHSDGEIGFFNDAALGIAPTSEELIEYSLRLGFDKTNKFFDYKKHNRLMEYIHLKESGYIHIESKDTLVLFDVAKIGPDYLPGHAHADTLSLECSLFGQRLLVNSGTSCYGISQERLRQRGTAAHNTVVIDEQNSSEVWGGFRVARRAYPKDLKINGNNEEITINCSHDGYTRLKGRPIHHRTLKLTEKSLLIEDAVSGKFKSAEAYFHFHPAIVLRSEEDGSRGELIFKNQRKAVWQIVFGAAKLAPSTYHPRFGIVQSAQCLVVSLKDGKSHFEITWD